MNQHSCNLPWTDWDKETYIEIQDVLAKFPVQPLPMNFVVQYTPQEGVTLYYDEPITPEECTYMKGIILRCKEIQTQVGQLQLMPETKA